MAGVDFTELYFPVNLATRLGAVVRRRAPCRTSARCCCRSWFRDPAERGAVLWWISGRPARAAGCGRLETMPLAISVDLRDRVVAAVNSGMTRYVAARHFRVSPASAVR